MVTPALLLFAPLAACAAIVGITRRSRPLSAGLAIGGMAVSLLCTVRLFLEFLNGHAHELQYSIPWITLPGLTLEFGFLINEAALLMSGVVTGVGLLIFIYSVGYMAEEEHRSRYFAYLSGFAFSMLGIVLANNLVTLFIFWELVGACSYLLIGYWYQKPSAAAAGKKAFLVNRIADFGFLLGILLLWSYSAGHGEAGTVNLLALQERLAHWAAAGQLDPTILGWIGVLLFCGVVGKSAQFPLHVWLPDAMEGPTPVSALIHAATMVAAGVYLLARIFFIVSAVPSTMELIAAIGGFTAIFAASLALVEPDIKRILAFSTLSQLGYMVMAMGLGAPVAAMFHLTTHAFFKALLFLGAGSVIHAVHGNDIWKMGGLLKKMPLTGWTFAVGTLALCGIFPFSGFFSKDEILLAAMEHNRFLWVIGTITAGMTAFYMGRLFFVAFLRPAASDSAQHAHESPAVMTGPLVVLALLSAAAGFFGIPAFLQGAHHAEHHGINWGVAGLSTAVAFAGLGLAGLIYLKGWRPAAGLLKKLESPGRWLSRKFFVDEIYGWINWNLQQGLARFLALFERWVIIGFMVNGTAKLTQLAGRAVRRLQTGQLQSYALSILVGLTLILLWGWRP
ncbi:MAG: NADH-quinone oxidoreductase subunit L [Candidatus Omnitrophica bacterium CG11_big_fil_rev_8_21_14_0_20_64_10]|nr:MAG: NADH-quinone oxidoreductase subunit L [Candidatus Omnitrophica bacterium CG11_big_fil_rev_8_21_14_0_20_64_10]